MTTKQKQSADEMVILIKRIANQKPSKPDYWNTCSQCERNQADAEDALATLAATKEPAPVQADWMRAAALYWVEERTGCQHEEAVALLTATIAKHAPKPESVTLAEVKLYLLTQEDPWYPDARDIIGFVEAAILAERAKAKEAV